MQGLECSFDFSRSAIGADVTLTVPVWLYLRLAHALHGIARSLCYDSPPSLAPCSSSITIPTDYNQSHLLIQSSSLFEAGNLVKIIS